MSTSSAVTTESDSVNNPLLSTGDVNQLPAFARVKPEHVAPALDVLLAQAAAALETVTASSFAADYDALSAVLDVATVRLGHAWGMVTHLNAVADSPELRSAYTDNLARVTEFYTRLGADERLYAKYKAVAQSAGAATLTAPRKRALSNALRDFVLSGAELQGDDKLKFAQLQESQAQLGQTFSEHVLDATDQFSLYATAEQMRGVPADVQQAAAALAQADGKKGYKITLHFPSYFPVLQYAHDRGLREQIYRANVTRASELGAPELDNSEVMRQLLAQRQEEARLLGYANYAEVSLATKMADSPEQVMQFLRDLAQRAKPYAAKDLAELRRFAKEELNLPDLQAWDISYASEKLKEARYAFSEQEVKQYFTEPKVLEGLFRIIETLFGVSIKPDVAPVWHDSVRFFRIERPQAAGQDLPATLVGQFYLDLYDGRCA
jgi:oligopeptidase A